MLLVMRVLSIVPLNFKVSLRYILPDESTVVIDHAIIDYRGATKADHFWLHPPCFCAVDSFLQKQNNKLAFYGSTGPNFDVDWTLFRLNRGRRLYHENFWSSIRLSGRLHVRCGLCSR